MITHFPARAVPDMSVIHREWDVRHLVLPLVHKMICMPFHCAYLLLVFFFFFFFFCLDYFIMD